MLVDLVAEQHQHLALRGTNGEEGRELDEHEGHPVRLSQNGLGIHAFRPSRLARENVLDQGPRVRLGKARLAFILMRYALI